MPYYLWDKNSAMGKGHRICEICGIREQHDRSPLLFSLFPSEPNRWVRTYCYYSNYDLSSVLRQCEVNNLHCIVCPGCYKWSLEYRHSLFTEAFLLFFSIMIKSMIQQSIFIVPVLFWIFFYVMNKGHSHQNTT